MILGIQGTKDFDSYNVFLYGMRVALSGMSTEDNEILIYSAGPAKTNSMVLEFSNISERGLKARGISIKVVKLPPNVLKDKISEIDYFAFFCNPKESEGPLSKEARDKDIEAGVFRF